MEELALIGGPKVIKDNMPHFIWPIITQKTEQAVIAQLHQSISIYDRSGVICSFEDRFREYHGLKYALLNNSGTSSIYSMYKSVGIGPGDEVICPIYTFFATVTPLLFMGGVPVFCDCQEDDGNIDPLLIEKKISPRTKAIIVTHMWGMPCLMDEIQQIARKHNLYLLEDCSHAHGARYNGKLVGTFGDAAVWSLQGQKILTGGEGGILSTNNEDIYAIAQLVGHYNKRSLHEIPNNHTLYRFGVTGFGQKFRSHPLAVAIANEQFDHLEEWLDKKNQYAVMISDALREFKFLKMPTYPNRYPSWYGFIIKYDSNEAGVLLDYFVEALHVEGLLEVDIPKSTGPLDLYPIFHEPALLFPEFYTPQTDFIQNCTFERAHEYYNSIIKLPIWVQQDDIAIVQKYIEGLRKICYHVTNHPEKFKKTRNIKGGKIMDHAKLDNLAQTAIADEIQKLVVGAVIRYNNRYLVLRRVSTDFMGGLIELASGGVDPDESLVTALIREVKEETFLEISEITGYLSSFDYKSGSGKRARQLNFLVTVLSDAVKLNPQEHDWYTWIKIPSDDFDQLNISAHTRAVLLQALSGQYEEV